MTTLTTATTVDIMTTDTRIEIEEIENMVRSVGLDMGRFWDHAMGGDRAALPREDVERLIRELTE